MRRYSPCRLLTPRAITYYSKQVAQDPTGSGSGAGWRRNRKDTSPYAVSLDETANPPPGSLVGVDINRNYPVQNDWGMTTYVRGFEGQDRYQRTSRWRWSNLGYPYYPEDTY